MAKTYPLSFRVTREQEQFLKNKAINEDLTLAAYVKSKVFSEEQPLNRPIIESEIESLKRTLNMCMGSILQQLDQIEQEVMSSSIVQRELMLTVLQKASDDPEWVERTYNSALEAARQLEKAQ